MYSINTEQSCVVFNVLTKSATKLCIYKKIAEQKFAPQNGPELTKIDNMVSLPSLIFLDLYQNRITHISNLHTVPTLKVLMLGKNTIESGMEELE